MEAQIIAQILVSSIRTLELLKYLKVKEDSLPGHKVAFKRSREF